MKISEALTQLSSLPYLVVDGDCTLEEVSAKIKNQRQVRGIYVKDPDGRLQGTLSVGVLIRHLATPRHKPLFHARSWLARLTSGKVGDLMDKHVVFARPDEEVGNVLERMLDTNIKEIPVVDYDRRIIAVLSLLDLWDLLGK